MEKFISIFLFEIDKYENHKNNRNNEINCKLPKKEKLIVYYIVAANYANKEKIVV